MRRVRKSSPPNPLTVYASENPDDIWESFRNYSAGADQVFIKWKIFSEQNFICAYCEVDLSKEKVPEHHRRIEHFNSKSGWVVGQAQPNWHLDWNNLIGVCVGGTDRDNLSKYDMPANKSCDAYKEHLETMEGHSKSWVGDVVSPLEVNLSYQMFIYDMASGKLKSNIDYCAAVALKDNNLNTTQELVDFTIVAFNLNCERLNNARRAVHFEYESIKKNFRITRDESKFKYLLNKWINSNAPLCFQTTRDLLVQNCTVAQKVLSN